MILCSGTGLAIPAVTRSHMLKLHQRYGLIAAVPLAATVLTGGLAGGRDTSSTGRNLHAALGLTSVGL